jgi:hypothetical protein
MTINNRCPVAPNIGSARHMGQVHRLAFIAPLRAAPARPGRAVAASPHADERTSLSIHALDILLCDLPGSLHPSTVTPRAADNQTPDAMRSSAECVRPRLRPAVAGPCLPRTHSRARGNFRSRHTLRIARPRNAIITRRTSPAS